MVGCVPQLHLEMLILLSPKHNIAAMSSVINYTLICEENFEWDVVFGSVEHCMTCIIVLICVCPVACVLMSDDATSDSSV